MNTFIYSDSKELSVATARIIAEVVRQKPDAMLCFPSGETSLGTFGELAAMAKDGMISFKTCKFVGLDEWVNLGSMKYENCYHFLKKHLFDPLGISQSQICFFNGEADDLVFECHKTDDFIKSNGGIDMMLLGVGMNGHLGLNEPGGSFDLYSHVVELDPVTRTVGQKYFSKAIKLSKGITLGMMHIKEAKTVILQISGKRKASIVQRLLSEGISVYLPATFVKIHPNSYLLLDAEANATN